MGPLSNELPLLTLLEHLTVSLFESKSSLKSLTLRPRLPSDRASLSLFLSEDA